MSSPRVFVSHSHADKSAAEQLARALMAQSVDAWLDKWEIQPGDSLIQKIFEEGLRDCAAFLVLLSPESVSSNWVRHELDVAMVKRIEGSTRVIPVIVRPCEIPVSLRPLLWVDMASGVAEAAKRIADAVYRRNERPPLAPPPSEVVHRVQGLTEPATTLAVLLSGSLDSSTGRPAGFDAQTLTKSTNMSPEDLNDAVEELESKGLVKVHKFLGTAPYRFGIVEPTYALGLQLRGSGAVPYDPEEDVLVVGAALNALKAADGPSLRERTGLSASRINNAISYLDDYGYIKVLRALGTAPFGFAHVESTGALRRFLSENAR